MNTQTINIQFKKNQLHNLTIFLNRVDLKGIQEAQAMMDIVRILNSPPTGGNDEENIELL